MNDMSSVIIPKSDQINADDLIAGPMTITIREVQIRGGQEQPVSIYFDGSDKAYRPCKSMSRVLVQGWGPDANKYLGRSLTLYRDPTVKWAGMEVGGIRISHMSDIDGEKLMMLTATKGSRKPHKVLPLASVPAAKGNDVDPRAWADKFMAQVKRAPDVDKLNAFVASKKAGLDDLASKSAEIRAEVQAAIADRIAELDDPFAGDATDWQSRTDELLGRIGNADDPADLGQCETDYRAVMSEMPKALADQVEAALHARKQAIEGEG